MSPESSSPSKDALLEEACKKYDEATRLCPTLHDVCTGISYFDYPVEFMRNLFVIFTKKNVNLEHMPDTN